MSKVAKLTNESIFSRTEIFHDVSHATEWPKGWKCNSSLTYFLKSLRGLFSKLSRTFSFNLHQFSRVLKEESQIAVALDRRASSFPLSLSPFPFSFFFLFCAVYSRVVLKVQSDELLWWIVSGRGKRSSSAALPVLRIKQDAARVEFGLNWCRACGVALTRVVQYLSLERDNARRYLNTLCMGATGKKLRKLIRQANSTGARWPTNIHTPRLSVREAIPINMYTLLGVISYTCDYFGNAKHGASVCIGLAPSIMCSVRMNPRVDERVSRRVFIFSIIVRHFTICF